MSLIGSDTATDHMDMHNKYYHLLVEDFVKR